MALDLRKVLAVGRRDVDHVDRVVAEQLVEVAIGAWNAEPGGPFGAAFIARAKQTAHLDADAAQSLDMDGADEATADHGRANIAQGSLAGRRESRPNGKRRSKRFP